MSTDPSPRYLDLRSAAEKLDLTESAVRALAGAGYIAAAATEDDAPTFAVPELEAFVTRNAGRGTKIRCLEPLPRPNLEPDELVALLDERAEHMARRMLKMYATVFPRVQAWSPQRQGKFVVTTKNRFEALLSIALGNDFDEALIEDLRRIGAQAADMGVKLPQILLLLRVSRDLVVQNAIDLAESDARPGGFALSLLLTRILPAMDRLSDALAAGYWETMFPG